jgi:hypothetical protein
MSTRTVTLDWDSLEEVSRLFNQSKSRFFELKREATGTPSRKQRYREVFEACKTIWDTDISAVYSGLKLDEENKYYVYAHLDGGKKIAIGVNAITTFAATLGFTHAPFYIGKGSGNRLYEKDRNETHRKVRQKIDQMGQEATVFTVCDSLTESEALQREAKLFDIFGLMSHGGRLCNLDEGSNASARRELYKAPLLLLRKINQELYA